VREWVGYAQAYIETVKFEEVNCMIIESRSQNRRDGRSICLRLTESTNPSYVERHHVGMFT